MNFPKHMGAGISRVSSLHKQDSEDLVVQSLYIRKISEDGLSV